MTEHKNCARLRLARLYAENPGTAMTQEEITKVLHVSRKTLHRVLTELKQQGVIERRIVYIHAQHGKDKPQ